MFNKIHTATHTPLQTQTTHTFLLIQNATPVNIYQYTSVQSFSCAFNHFKSCPPPSDKSVAFASFVKILEKVINAVWTSFSTYGHGILFWTEYSWISFQRRSTTYSVDRLAMRIRFAWSAVIVLLLLGAVRTALWRSRGGVRYFDVTGTLSPRYMLVSWTLKEDDDDEEEEDKEQKWVFIISTCKDIKKKN